MVKDGSHVLSQQTWFRCPQMLVGVTCTCWSAGLFLHSHLWSSAKGRISSEFSGWKGVVDVRANQSSLQPRYAEERGWVHSTSNRCATAAEEQEATAHTGAAKLEKSGNTARCAEFLLPHGTARRASNMTADHRHQTWGCVACLSDNVAAWHTAETRGGAHVQCPVLFFRTWWPSAPGTPSSGSFWRQTLSSSFKGKDESCTRLARYITSALCTLWTSNPRSICFC